jgi:hypothetical protein
MRRQRRRRRRAAEFANLTLGRQCRGRSALFAADFGEYEASAWVQYSIFPQIERIVHATQFVHPTRIDDLPDERRAGRGLDYARPPRDAGPAALATAAVIAQASSTRTRGCVGRLTRCDAASSARGHDALA